MLRAIQWKKPAALPLQALIRPAAAAAAMFFMMHAQLLMNASPLAAALMAAGLAAGESPGALVLGCLAGMIRLPVSQSALLPAVSCTLALAQHLLFGLHPFRFLRDSQTRASLSAGLAVLLPGMAHANAALLPSLQILACSALAAAAAPFLFDLLKCRKRRNLHALNERTGAALLAGGCIAALEQICPPIAESMCSLMVLLIPMPATGILSGLALAAGGAGLMKTASLALCALVCGSGLFTRSRQRAPAACAAALLAAFMAGPEALQPQWMLCAAAVYVLLPASLLSNIESAALPRREGSCNPDEIAHAATREFRRRLTALSEAFSVMAEGSVGAVAVPDEQELICEMRGRLCTGCPSYGECWAGEDNRAVHLLCTLIGEALERVDAPPGMRILFSDGEIPPDVLRICRRGRMIPDRLGLLLRDFAERRRSEIKRCTDGRLMSVQFLQAKEILLNLARNNASPGMQPLHAALMCAGLGDCEAVANSPDASSVTLLRAEKRWNRSEISRAARAIGQTLGGRYQVHTSGDALIFVRSPRLQADSGASCQSGVAGEICGDSHLVRMLGSDKLMLAISDGMGSGEAAAAESAEALRLLWRFLDAGISRSLALETVNRQLLMRSSLDMFATIDLCIIDLNSGIAEFIKLAASPTLILREKEMLHIDGGRLPLGILENVQPGVRRFRLRPGDMLVMGSDGVMEAGDGLSVERYARENSHIRPAQLAENLVRHAALQRSDGRQDDLTCICVRIGNAKRS